MSLKHGPLFIALLLSLPGCAHRAAEVRPDTRTTSHCAQAPLLQRYARSGMVEALSEDRVRLSVLADVHGQDCGTPDCYFTRVQAVFHFAGGDACHVEEVEVSTEDGGCGQEAPHVAPRLETFVPHGASDLADPTLAQLVLRTRQGDRALVVLPRNLFYFTDVKEGAPLHTTLPTGEEDETECCWGASIAEANFREEPATE
ncbi:hypothetical protein LZ198_12925 [Myxococcus sp. K15C18031901]|uniref:hypothetical protein n=1 Tax=Myxococcus dinghuensis TaxID=2906761 RepID=UPI0020A80C34|nr:hypothetical protein [Myxococcus dinghuensis]MCP3099770.1 hypothetical protein [Myxococcus dinghuensis]